MKTVVKTVTFSENTKRIDVIVAIVKDSNNVTNYKHRIFLNAVEMGIGAEIIDRSKTIREKISSRMLSSFAGIVATMPTYKSNTCEGIKRLINDNKIKDKIWTKMTMSIIANGRFLGGGFQPATKADMTDGLLDTVIIKNSNSFKILEKFVSIKKGEEYITNQNDIYYGQSQTVALISNFKNNITVSVDGEPIVILPLFFRVFHQVLKIRI